MNDLFDQLSSRKITIPPPGRMQGITEITRRHQTNGSGLARIDHAFEVFDGFTKPKHKADLGDNSGAFSRIHHLPALFGSQRDRLFNENMYAQLCCNLYFVGMSVGRQADNNDIQRNLIKHLMVICKYRRCAVGILLRKGCGFFNGAIAEGNHLKVIV